MKRNNSVPDGIDKLPEISMKGKGDFLLQMEEKLKSKKSGPGSKNFDDSFKRNQLDIIKEDKDDEYCKYKDDFEPVVNPEDLKQYLGGNIKTNKIIDSYINAKRSAEPHLHKSKAMNLQPLAELSQLQLDIIKNKTPLNELANLKV